MRQENWVTPNLVIGWFLIVLAVGLTERWLPEVSAQSLPFPGGTSPISVEPEWNLTRTVNLANCVAAHYNPRDGLLYVGRRNSDSDGLYRVNRDGSVAKIANGDKLAAVVVDPDKGDIFFSEDYAGVIYRVEFGTTNGKRTPWVSGFHDGDDDPIGMAITPNRYTGTVLKRGEGLVVDRGYNGPNEVWRFSPDTLQSGTVIHRDTGILINPVDITIGSDTVYLVDNGDKGPGSIYRLEAGGSVSPISIQEEIGNPVGIAADLMTGALFVLDRDGKRVVRVSPSTGKVNEVFTGFQLANWACIDVAPDGSQIFVTDHGAGNIYTFQRGISVFAIENKAVNPGDQFKTNISGRLAKQLHRFSFDLTFDPSALQAVSVEEGSLLSRGGEEPTSWKTPTINNKSGVIRDIRCSRTEKNGIREKGILAIVTFKAIETGSIGLTVENLRLLSPAGEELETRGWDGSVDVYPHGSISGLVIDAATNKPIQGARVEVSKGGYNFDMWTVTGEDGTYVIDGVPIGDCEVTVSKEDCLPETISNVRVNLGKKTSNVDIEMMLPLTAAAITIPKLLGVGDNAVDFTMSDMNGKKVSLSNFKGKPVILSFWSSTSEHCRRQIPYLNMLYEKYRNNGLVVVGVNKEIDRNSVLQYAQNHLSYIVLLNGAKTFRSYGVGAVPCTYYIDRTGKVYARGLGFSAGSETKMEQKTKKLLGTDK